MQPFQLMKYFSIWENHGKHILGIIWQNIIVFMSGNCVFSPAAVPYQVARHLKESLMILFYLDSNDSADSNDSDGESGTYSSRLGLIL